MTQIIHDELPEELPEEKPANFIERTRAKFESFMRWLGTVQVRDNVKRRRGESAMTASRRLGRSQVHAGPRLGRPRGPGTIHAKADGLYLARVGKFKEAAEMLEQQFPELAARYRRFADDPAPSLNFDYDPGRFVP